MRAAIVIAALLAVATAMPHERAHEQAELDAADAAAAADITELSGDALLEARAGLQARVGANEAFDTAPYKFFLWNPTQALTRKTNGQELPLRKTQWGPRRTPEEINKKLKQSITGAGLPGKCGANDRCVLLGPEFLAHGNDRLTSVEYGEYKRDLTALSTAYPNVLLAPGTVVYKAKASQQRCAADHQHPFKPPQPETESKKWYGSQVDYDGCMYNFNVLVVAFRGAILIEHYKVQDGGSAVGAAYDLTARPDLVGATPQSQFRVPAWGNILVGVEICADHELHRVKAATNDAADLQLSPFFPGTISANSIAMTGVKDGGFVLQNGGNSPTDQVFKRNGQQLTRFYRAAPGQQGYVSQVGVSRAFDVYEYIGVAQPPPQPPQGGPPQVVPPRAPRTGPVRSNSQRTLKPVRPVTRTNSQPQIKRRGST